MKKLLFMTSCFFSPVQLSLSILTQKLTPTKILNPASNIITGLEGIILTLRKPKTRNKTKCTARFLNVSRSHEISNLLHNIKRTKAYQRNCLTLTQKAQELKARITRFIKNSYLNFFFNINYWGTLNLFFIY